MPKLLNTLTHRVYVTDPADPLLSYKIRSGGEVEAEGEVADRFLAVDGVVDAGSSAAKAWHKEHKDAAPTPSAAPGPEAGAADYSEMKKAELVTEATKAGMDESEAKKLTKADLVALLDEPTGGGTITTAKTPAKKGR